MHLREAWISCGQGIKEELLDLGPQIMKDGKIRLVCALLENEADHSRDL